MLHLNLFLLLFFFFFYIIIIVRDIILYLFLGYIYLHVSVYIVCVAYPLNVRSTMEIRRSHLCDFFLVLPFLKHFLTRYCFVNKIYQQQQQQRLSHSHTVSCLQHSLDRYTYDDNAKVVSRCCSASPLAPFNRRTTMPVK